MAGGMLYMYVVHTCCGMACEAPPVQVCRYFCDRFSEIPILLKVLKY